MGINLGTATPADYRLGNASVSAIYLGSTVVWSSAPPFITITSQPANQVTSGSTGSFTVAASVTQSATLSYQWQRQALGTGSFADISGANSATLSLTGLTTTNNQGDKYRCIVSATGATSVTSDAAEWLFYNSGALFFNPNADWTTTGFSGNGSQATPYLKSGNGIFTPYGYATIRVAAAGYVVVRTQTSIEAMPGFITVVRNNVGVGGAGSVTANAGIAPLYASFSVAAGDTIAIFNDGAKVSDLSMYFWDGSSSATITVTSHPSPQTASGGAATFAVTATNSTGGALYYQWQRQALGAGSFVSIFGATSASLTISGLTNSANNGDNYRCVVSSATASSVTSNAAALTVPAGGTATLAISRDNGVTTSFSGTGTSSSPYFRAAGFYDDESNGVSHYKWTASASATVTVSYYFSDDDGSDDAARIRKNGSIVYYTDHDTTVTRTISVVAGDEISIRGVMDGSQYFANVSVYAT
jgi:hypothetical protein